MQAKEIMHEKVVTARPGMSLPELVQMLDEHHISGVPVVASTGELVGVISQTDLVRRERAASPRMVPEYHQHPEGGSHPGGYQLEVPAAVKVAAVMTPWVIAFDEETTIEELAHEMLAKNVHRVIITRQGRLCGIVTSMDLLRALLAAATRK